MTKLTGCKQLYALVPGIAVAWYYAEKGVTLSSIFIYSIRRMEPQSIKKFHCQILIIARVP